MDAFCIPKNSANPEIAERYINFMLSEEAAVANAEYICYASPISEARNYMDEDLAVSPVIYPEESVLERGRGFQFLPADLYKSDVTNFKIEGNNLRVPFTAIGGLGESAAQGIVAVRDKPFLSVEDLKNRAKVSSAVIELLRAAGALDGLKDTNQVTLTELMGDLGMDDGQTSLF